MPESPENPPAPPSDSRIIEERPPPTDSAVLRGEVRMGAAAAGVPSDPTAAAPLRTAGADATTEAIPPGSGPMQEDLTLSPDRIPGYRIIRRIAVGGMGAVYEAEQQNPQRRVALKVVRPGATSGEIMRRFEFETRVLGRLNHPGIARIYGAGTWESALGPQPWFAMEFVEGEDLRTYARSRSLSTNACLEFTAQVADAVEHAHQRGIIHRDLKPGNILVTAEGRPVILDFGLARMVDSDMQAVSVRTEVGQILGTLLYMSPEQTLADPAAIDTRSDVYSLGVIAHELLTGRHPQDLRGRAVHEILLAIQTVEASSINHHGMKFPADVATILAKTMEKDKERRYASAGELALDIRRYLADEPIIARPPSVGYQIARFARRNRALVAGSCVAVLALVAGVIGFAWQAGVAATERDTARAARAEAERHLAEARIARLRVEDQQYLSNVQLAGVRLTAGLSALARELLTETAPRCRHWEWGYLMRLAAEQEGLDDVEDETRSGAGRRGEDGDAVSLWTGIDSPRVIPLTRGASGFERLAFAQDGELIAGASDQGVILVLERRTGRIVTSMSIGSPPAGALFFGQYASALLALETGASRIASWDAANGEPRQSFSEPGFAISGLTLAPDLVHVHAWSPDGRSMLINAATAHKIRDFGGEAVPLAGSRFSRDNRRLIAVTFDGSVIEWDVESGVRLSGGDRGSIVGVISPGSISDARFSPDLTRIVAQVVSNGSAAEPHGRNRLLLIDASSGAAPSEILPDAGSPIDVRFSTDGSLFLVLEDGRGIDLRRTADGEPVARLGGWSGQVTAAEFAPDGRHIVAGFSDGRIELMEPVSRGSGTLPRRVFGHTDMVYDLCFSPSGERLVSASYDGTARVWNVATRSERFVLRKHTSEVVEAMYSSDGRFIVTAGWDGLAQFWNARTGEPAGSRLVTPGEDVSATFTPRNPLFRSLAGVQKFDWSRDGRRLVGPALDNTARIVDFEDENFELELKHPPRGLGRGGVAAARMSPDGRRVITSSFDRTARVWDAATGEHLMTLEGHRGFVGVAFWSPDGRRIVTMSLDRTAKVWDAVTGAEIFPVERDGATVQNVMFSPDSRLLLAGFSDSDAQIHTAADGERLAQLRGHASGIFTARFSPDGRRILTAAADRTIKIWNLEGDEQVTLEPETPVTCVEWSPDGRIIAAGTHEGAIQFWEASAWK